MAVSRLAGIAGTAGKAGVGEGCIDLLREAAVGEVAPEEAMLVDFRAAGFLGSTNASLYGEGGEDEQIDVCPVARSSSDVREVRVETNDTLELSFRCSRRT
jgi:hypothetical protein